MKSLRILLAAGAFSLMLDGQTDWPVFLGDPGGSKFSTLTDINPQNVANLKAAWKFDMGVSGSAEVTPLEIGGVLYFSSPRQVVFAADATNGRELWRYDPKVTRTGFHRGISYWPGDRNHKPRIVAGTGEGRLYVLDAATGQPIPSFGDNGSVDLRHGVADNFPDSPYGPTSPPAIYRDLAILGAEFQEGPAKGPLGSIRAFNIVTGKEVWHFNLLPQPGEPGNDTWGPDGWKDRAGPSAWAPITVDPERRMVFVGVGNPRDSFYGGDRPGINLYSDSTVALDADTGKLRWYFQTVHHDLYDFDIPSPPALIEVVRNGKTIPAVAQLTKHGLLFILDRVSGKPLYDVEERPIPKSDVPGEKSWPTQPFPVKPPPLVRLSVTEAELNRTTPETAAACEALFKTLKHDGPYTAYNASQRSLVFPDTGGGSNWYGVSFDPKLGYIFANITNRGVVGRMVPRQPDEMIRYTAGPTRPAMPYTNEQAYTPRGGFNDPITGRPCFQPPWGELFAINANTGDIAWRVPLGTDEAMEAKGIMNTGTGSNGGALVTATGLLFIAATTDGIFRAFDSRTGKILWATRTDGTARATPMTYKTKNGKQFILVYAGGTGGGGGRGAGQAPPAGGAAAAATNASVIAYALP